MLIFAFPNEKALKQEAKKAGVKAVKEVGDQQVSQNGYVADHLNVDHQPPRRSRWFF
jgi:hypothetical protein